MGQQFFDINKLKPWNGLLRFPISLSRIANAQSAKMYFETYIPHISPSKILTPTIWANFCYSDMLYMYSDQPATTLKKKYMSEIYKHKNESKKYLGKPQVHLWKTPKDASYYIPNSFSFDSWTSLYLWYEWDFPFILKRLYDIYQNDSVFQNYLEADCKDNDKLITNDQIMFFLEKHLMMYLISRMKTHLINLYVPNYDWILQSYPGKPLRHQIYIFQQDFFGLGTSRNVYADSWYDLWQCILYDMSKIDLKTYI